MHNIYFQTLQLLELRRKIANQVEEQKLQYESGYNDSQPNFLAICVRIITGC